MSLLIEESDSFDIVVKYIEQDNGIKFLDAKEENPKVIEEIFTFKKQNWKRSKIIMSSSVIIDANGQAKVDPYKLMDIKIKILLKDWSLKTKDGIKLEVTNDNIDKLNPGLIQYLFTRLSAITE